jgi:hypothetical protein
MNKIWAALSCTVLLCSVAAKCGKKHRPSLANSFQGEVRNIDSNALQIATV